MIRGMLVLLVSVMVLTPASASLDRKERRALPRDVPVKSLRLLPTAASDDFRITAATEVLLDGRPCRYEQVPNSATIILLETTSNESKEITRIHFSTTRRPSSSPTSR
jgi:hypothetical protein